MYATDQIIPHCALEHATDHRAHAVHTRTQLIPRSVAIRSLCPEAQRPGVEDARDVRCNLKFLRVFGLLKQNLTS